MAVSPLGFGASTGTTSGAKLAENFETFLTLLTEQMKNQDPLSPMDSTEFVSQLVEFSNVEQQINQNSNLETLIGLQLAASQTGAASYLGREVTLATPLSELADGEARWSYTLPRDAASAKLVIENTEGKVVRVVDAQISAGSHDYVWDGKDNAGAELPDGVYRMSVAAVDAEDEEISATLENRGRVTSVDFSNGDPVLFIGKVGASMADVRSLREYVSPDDGDD